VFQAVKFYIMNKLLLSIQNLKISLKRGIYSSVIKNISYDLQQWNPRDCGESGSGKSVSSLAIMGLLPDDFENFRRYY
jgi:ABC-type microcin C transport system duplicated ATPase subunit YejF